MSLEEIEEKLRHVFVEQCGVKLKDVRMDAQIVADLGVDSLDLVELVMAAEETFDVTLPDDGETAIYRTLFSRTGTVGELAELIYVQKGTGCAARVWPDQEASVSLTQAVFTQLGSSLPMGRVPGDGLHVKIEDVAEFNQYSRRTDGMICVEIPAAEVVIGNPAAAPGSEQSPSHRVAMSSFLIDLLAVGAC
jgi:acyl carrier protein